MLSSSRDNTVGALRNAHLSLSVFLISAFLFERERRKRLLSLKEYFDMNWMPKEALDFRGSTRPILQI